MKRLLILLMVIALTACGSPATATPAPATTAPEATQAPEVISAEATVEPTTASASPVLFKIIKADGSTFDVTLDAVKSLPLAQLTVEGKVQEGPKLLDVLNLAGVTEFSEVTLTGTSTSTLTREQVDDNTILDFSNRGTMKLATTYIPKANWAKDIAEITIK